MRGTNAALVAKDIFDSYFKLTPVAETPAPSVDAVPAEADATATASNDGYYDYDYDYDN